MRSYTTIVVVFSLVISLLNPKCCSSLSKDNDETPLIADTAISTPANGKSERNLETSSSASSPRSCIPKKLETPCFIYKSFIKKFTNDKEAAKKKGMGGKVLVNTHRKTFDRRNEFEKCEFKEDGPVPVLFICNGRSGSSNTWMTLSMLAGRRNSALETMGSDGTSIEKMMQVIGTEEAGQWFVREHLCEIAQLWCDSSIVGFQWKPYAGSIRSPAGTGMLNKISKSQRIKVLWMTRNPIDVFMSRVKHSANGEHVSAHCKPNDTECLKMHSKAGLNIFLQKEELLKYLKGQHKIKIQVQDALNQAGVDYYNTTYEKLYTSEDAEEWMNIFRYFGKGPTEGLTMQKVSEAFPLAKTSKRTRKEVIENYDEIENLLQDTDYIQYLYE